MALGETSGTYDFNPGLGDIVLFAFGLCGVRRAALTQEHMENSRMAANLVLADWSNKLVNAWAVDLVEEALVEGQSVYDVDPSTVQILDAYIRTTVGGEPQDRIILPVGRSDYAAYPNKEQAGYPTTYWYDRLVEPTMTIWPVPDEALVDTNDGVLRYYRVRQVQDAGLANAQTPEVPYRFLAAFAYGLAVPLSEIYAPDRSERLTARASGFWDTASQTDGEGVGLNVFPGMGGYFD